MNSLFIIAIPVIFYFPVVLSSEAFGKQLSFRRVRQTDPEDSDNLEDRYGWNMYPGSRLPPRRPRPNPNQFPNQFPNTFPGQDQNPLFPGINQFPDQNQLPNQNQNQGQRPVPPAPTPAPGGNPTG